MVAHIIANETGATMFNLSAANIAGKYPGKDGLKMLIHMVSKVGKALQPSVIYIGDCEKQFLKKVPKADKEVYVSCLIFRKNVEATIINFMLLRSNQNALKLHYQNF